MSPPPVPAEAATPQPQSAPLVIEYVHTAREAVRANSAVTRKRVLPVSCIYAASLPWLRYLRQGLGARAHFWPFERLATTAWPIRLAEVYPALWGRAYPSEERNSQQHDA